LANGLPFAGRSESQTRRTTLCPLSPSNLSRIASFFSFWVNSHKMQDLSAAHLGATTKLEEARVEAESRLKEEKQKCQRMLEAAATGQFPSYTAPAAATSAHAQSMLLPLIIGDL